MGLGFRVAPKIATLGLLTTNALVACRAILGYEDPLPADDRPDAAPDARDAREIPRDADREAAPDAGPRVCNGNANRLCEDFDHPVFPSPGWKVRQGAVSRDVVLSRVDGGLSLPYAMRVSVDGPILAGGDRLLDAVYDGSVTTRIRCQFTMRVLARPSERAVPLELIVSTGADSGYYLWNAYVTLLPKGGGWTVQLTSLGVARGDGAVSPTYDTGGGEELALGEWTLVIFSLDFDQAIGSRLGSPFARVAGLRDPRPIRDVSIQIGGGEVHSDASVAYDMDEVACDFE